RAARYSPCPTRETWRRTRRGRIGAASACGCPGGSSPRRPCGSRFAMRSATSSSPVASASSPPGPRRMTAPTALPAWSRSSRSARPVRPHELDELGILALHPVHRLAHAAAKVDDRALCRQLDRLPYRPALLPVLELGDGRGPHQLTAAAG